MAGPVMVASWVVEAPAATARGNSGPDTTLGSKVCWIGESNARPTPNTNTAARMNSLVTQSAADPTASAAAASASTVWQICSHRGGAGAGGDLARPQHEGGRRQELDEADQAEVEGAAGERVHLPGHRHAQHLEAHGGAGARGPIERERAVAQDGVRHGGGRVHRRGLTSCRRQRLRARLGKDARFGVVEPRGVEPLTSSLRTRRSPN